MKNNKLKDNFQICTTSKTTCWNAKTTC